jgi:hypothetical protein
MVQYVYESLLPCVHLFVQDYQSRKQAPEKKASKAGVKQTKAARAKQYGKVLSREGQLLTAHMSAQARRDKARQGKRSGTGIRETSLQLRAN